MGGQRAGMQALVASDVAEELSTTARVFNEKTHDFATAAAGALDISENVGGRATSPGGRRRRPGCRPDGLGHGVLRGPHV